MVFLTREHAWFARKPKGYDAIFTLNQGFKGQSSQRHLGDPF